MFERAYTSPLPKQKEFNPGPLGTAAVVLGVAAGVFVWMVVGAVAIEGLICLYHFAVKLLTW